MNEEKMIDCPYAEKGCSRELSECIKRHFTDYPKPCFYLEIEEVFFCEEVDEMLERYYALCAQAHRKHAWISVEDALPQSETERVLVFLKDADFTKPIGVNKIDTDRYVGGVWVRWGRYVTHWMPLPDPPKGEEHV